MHFFNPVSKMPLVEIIKGKKSSSKALATVYKMALDMGKFPIVCSDGPGFLVNRCLGIYMGEAGRMLDEGCDPAKVDKLIKEFGMPMGPYRLLDEVGIDVAAHVGPTLKNGLGPRFAESPTLEKMVKANVLGKKTNKGFWKYDAKQKETEIDVAGLKSLGVIDIKSEFKYTDVTDRCILCMVNEAAMILSEKIVEFPEDVDLGMVFGTGFAPFRGGLLYYSDNRGIGAIVDTLNTLAAKYGERFKPCDMLVQMSLKKERFFPDRPNVPMTEGKAPKPKVKFF
jgi:3-hydroxyacyl-CoA dehydrogenase/enoyl-CoA hydratase/3-hydroxybutyryl-CoA epimerase